MAYITNYTGTFITNIANTHNPEWMCDICGKIRPDKDIKVHTYIISGSNTFIENKVKYCFDRADCLKGALDIEDADRGLHNLNTNY